MATTLRRTYVGADGKLIVEEVIQDDLVSVPKKDKLTNKGNDWIVIFQGALLRIATETDLSKGAYKLLIFLIAKTEIDQNVKLPIQEMATAIGEHKGNIYKFVKELEIINVLIRDTKSKLIRLNYELAYKGKFADYKKLQYKDEQLLKQPESSPLFTNK
jgi:hypothetical protein